MGGRGRCEEVEVVDGGGRRWRVWRWRVLGGAKGENVTFKSGM